jgi:hypothetical protein
MYRYLSFYFSFSKKYMKKTNLCKIHTNNYKESITFALSIF